MNSDGVASRLTAATQRQQLPIAPGLLSPTIRFITETRSRQCEASACGARSRVVSVPASDAPTPPATRPRQTGSASGVAATRRGASLLPTAAVAILGEWFSSHFSDPYPTAAERRQLAVASGLTAKQVMTWFANARKRVWAPQRRRLEGGRHDGGSSCWQINQPRHQPEFGGPSPAVDPYLDVKASGDLPPPPALGLNESRSEISRTVGNSLSRVPVSPAHAAVVLELALGSASTISASSSDSSPVFEPGMRVTAQGLARLKQALHAEICAVEAAQRDVQRAILDRDSRANWSKSRQPALPMPTVAVDGDLPSAGVASGASGAGALTT